MCMNSCFETISVVIIKLKVTWCKLNSILVYLSYFPPLSVCFLLAKQYLFICSDNVVILKANKQITSISPDLVCLYWIACCSVLCFWFVWCVDQFQPQWETWRSATTAAWTSWACPGEQLRETWTVTWSLWEISRELFTPSLCPGSVPSVCLSPWCLDASTTSPSAPAAESMRTTPWFRSAPVRAPSSSSDDSLYVLQWWRCWAAVYGLIVHIMLCFSALEPATALNPTATHMARDNRLKVYWRHAAGDFDYYHVSIKHNNIFQQNKTVPKTQNECMFSGLVPGRLYTVIVSTWSGKYESSVSTHGRTCEYTCPALLWQLCSAFYYSSAADAFYSLLILFCCNSMAF